MTKNLGKIKFQHKDFEIKSKSNKIINYIPIKKINFFIGKNNSGKSRLFRRLLNTPHQEIMLGFNDEIANIFRTEMVVLEHADQMLEATNGQTYPKTIRENDNLFTWDQLLILKAYREKIKQQKLNPPSQNTEDTGRIRKEIQRQNGFNNDGALDYLDDMPKLAPRAIYIPILRGLRPIVGDVDPPYTKRTSFDYFNTDHEKKIKFSNYSLSSFPNNIFLEEIHTGEDLYEILKDHLLGEPDQRERIKEYEILLSDTFFSGKKVTLIPKNKQDVVYIKIGDDEQYPIYELGDGLQQCLIITFACFFDKLPAFVFIEEPELSMHPGFLGNLIEFLELHTDHTYFFTTHSNHLLDMVDTNAGVNVFKCSKIHMENNGAKFSVSEITKDRSLLVDLGVRASSLFMANCTIWVEGITDRFYLRAFLKRYIKKNKLFQYKENYHFSFIEYQGGNLVHWEFDDCQDDEEHILSNIKALNSSIHPFLLADGDIGKKGKRVDKYKEALADDFFILGCKEIENLITKEIVIETSKKLFNKFTRNTFGKTIDKLTDNLDYIKYSKDSKNGLGYFLDTALNLEIVNGEKCDRIFSSMSGTLKDKTDFCVEAVGLMEKSPEWQMTSSIEHLCKKIYSHIEKHNPLPKKMESAS